MVEDIMKQNNATEGGLPSPPFPRGFILGSGSPRRRDLLSEAGYHFAVEPSSAEELEPCDLEIRELTKANARLKAEEVSQRFPDNVILGADTLVTIDGKIMGKPTDREAALEMIRLLNGRTHQVMTGVCLMRQVPSLCMEHCEVTDVSFKTLSEEDLKNYHDLIDPMDKAGAYAAQEHGEVIIELTDGSWSNVVGLPMEAVKSMLEEFSIYPDQALT